MRRTDSLLPVALVNLLLVAAMIVLRHKEPLLVASCFVIVFFNLGVWLGSYL